MNCFPFIQPLFSSSNKCYFFCVYHFGSFTESLGKSHEWRSLVGCSPWGHEESDMTEWLHFHFSLSCIGEGNGNPLHCSCLENPRDGGAWWAIIYGVVQSRTWLKQLSSSSSSRGLQSQIISLAKADLEGGLWNLDQ